MGCGPAGPTAWIPRAATPPTKWNAHCRWPCRASGIRGQLHVGHSNIVPQTVPYSAPASSYSEVGLLPEHGLEAVELGIGHTQVARAAHVPH